MPTLEFKGKQHIYAHHLTVPHRPLVVDAKKSFPKHQNRRERDTPVLSSVLPDDNLIIHGDNLHALKALLPRYAGKINCIYIDPPYNTGNEGWVYNDNVNSEMMQQWLTKNKPVDDEDLERHDKWLCMMWPRLWLLRELLADDGIIFVSIDDNEQHHLRMIMDEIFEPSNFTTSFIWNKKNVVQNDAKFASVNHDYILAYRKMENRTRYASLPRTSDADSRYKNPDGDPRGPWQSVALQAKSGTADMRYQILFPNGISWEPPPGTYPKFTQDRLIELYEDGRLWFGKSGTNVPRLKKYLSEMTSGMVSNSILVPEIVGSTQSATEGLKRIMNDNVFESPKSPGLVQRLALLEGTRDGLILDSFAGSGTTAQAVLALNQADGGSRRFILIECGDEADAITAERVRRVIKGVPDAKDAQLRDGLGGSFTYCTLGEPLDLETMLRGDTLPAYAELAVYLLYTATGISVDRTELGPREDGWFFCDENTDYYMFYQSEKEWLQSNDAMFTLDRARDIRNDNPERKAVVFAVGKYVGQRELTTLNITFCQLPYELHRAGG